MFPGQRRIREPSQYELQPNIEECIFSIMSIARAQLSSGQFERRHINFPLFMAGFATTQAEVKVQVLNIMKVYEGHGIGLNTYRTRQLLMVVGAEQVRATNMGGSMEDVDWLTVAKERNLTVLNCWL